MSQKIIIGFDDSAESRDAVALACALADATSATLVIANVYFHDRFYDAYTFGDVEREADAEAKNTLKQALDLVGDRPAATVAVAASTTTRGLHELARERDAAVIVVGSTTRGAIGRVVAGTTARNLLGGGPCAVAVASRGPAEATPSIRTIGVAFDASRESHHALRVAGELAQAARAKVRLIRAVMAPLPIVGASYALTTGNRTVAEELREHAERECAQAMESLPASCRDGSDVAVGDPVAALVSRSADLDLLVCGSRGYGRGRQVLLGSTSAKLVDQAECPVLVVPRGAEVTGERASSGVQRAAVP